MAMDSKQAGAPGEGRRTGSAALLLLCAGMLLAAVAAWARPGALAAQVATLDPTAGAGALAAHAAAPGAEARAAHAAAPASAAPMSRAAFHDAMRKLWEDHVTWTRLYIVSAASSLPDKSATAQRLLANQADIGNAVADFYGRPAGDALTALLRSHILVAAELVDAAKAGDQAKVTDASRRWYANADSIASFLHQANPRSWPLATMQSAMKMHLDQTLAEATHRLQGNYAAEIEDYDHIVAHILGMADVLSDGIMAQFPARFAGARTMAQR